VPLPCEVADGVVGVGVAVGVDSFTLTPVITHPTPDGGASGINSMPDLPGLPRSIYEFRFYVRGRRIYESRSTNIATGNQGACSGIKVLFNEQNSKQESSSAKRP